MTENPSNRSLVTCDNPDLQPPRPRFNRCGENQPAGQPYRWSHGVYRWFWRRSLCLHTFTSRSMVSERVYITCCIFGVTWNRKQRPALPEIENTSPNKKEMGKMYFAMDSLMMSRCVSSNKVHFLMWSFALFDRSLPYDPFNLLSLIGGSSTRYTFSRCSSNQHWPLIWINHDTFQHLNHFPRYSPKHIHDCRPENIVPKKLRRRKLYY